MISKGKFSKGGGRKFTLAEGSPKGIRKNMGQLKDNASARNMNTGGDNAMNIMPTFEEAARKSAASGE